jgi:hypothetical protein
MTCCLFLNRCGRPRTHLLRVDAQAERIVGDMRKSFIKYTWERSGRLALWKALIIFQDEVFKPFGSDPDWEEIKHGIKVDTDVPSKKERGGGASTT